jgi:hypothetical protein
MAQRPGPSNLSPTFPISNSGDVLEKHTKTEQVKALTTAAMLGTAADQSYAMAGRKEVRQGRAVEGVKEPLDLAVIA